MLKKKQPNKILHNEFLISLCVFKTHLRIFKLLIKVKKSRNKYRSKRKRNDYDYVISNNTNTNKNVLTLVRSEGGEL